MWRSLIKGLADIIYPRICLACKAKLTTSANNGLICNGCWGKIKKNTPPFCHFCGRRLEKSGFTKNICPNCLKRKLHFNRAFSPCVYTGVVKDLIHEFKYKGKDYIGAELSKLMIDFIKNYNVPIDCVDFIIPVPLHKTKLREREFNQAEILSRHISKEFKKDLLTGALIRHRHTRTQTELETNDRLSNVLGSFSLEQNKEINGRNILLVDDVLTTGATSSEAALTLKNAGANLIFVLTLAS